MDAMTTVAQQANGVGHSGHDTIMASSPSSGGPVARARRVVLKLSAGGFVAIWDGKPTRSSIQHDSVHDER